MGILRFLLAIIVVCAHTQKNISVGPLVAVEIFFMISGFYMALILTNKYNSYWLFISNRFLKIYPVYWTVLLVVFLMGVIYGGRFTLNAWAPHFANMQLGTVMFLLLSNLFIIAQDLTLFMGFDSGSLYFTSNFSQTPAPQVWGFLLIPQSWSLAVELLFYMAIPFIIKNKYSIQLLIGIVLISLFIRVMLLTLGYNADPWNYRFFPSVMMLFCAGSLAFFSLTAFKIKASVRLMVCFVYFSWFLSYSDSHQTIFFSKNVAYIFTFIALPCLYSLTKDSRIQRTIGDLSYPIYVCHFFCIYLWDEINVRLSIPVNYNYLMVSLLSIIMAVCLHLLIQVPIESIRRRRLHSA